MGSQETRESGWLREAYGLVGFVTIGTAPCGPVVEISTLRVVPVSTRPTLSFTSSVYE